MNTPDTIRIPLATVTSLVAAALCSSARLDANNIDYAYAPPKWQTAICLPDDPFKSLVDSTGTLLYHFERFGFKESEREYGTRIAIEVTPTAKWRSQRLHSPRVPIVRTVRQDTALDVVEEAFAVTDLVPWDATKTDLSKQPRNDLLVAHITNRDGKPRRLSPKLVIDTGRAFNFDGRTQVVTLNNHELLTASHQMRSCAPDGPTRRVISLEEIEIPAGATATVALQYHGGGAVSSGRISTTRATEARANAISYWETAPLPYGLVQLPDPAVQAQIDSGIRNIWQAREFKNGRPVFQVGPTYYRGLWIVDGAFLLETATMLGAGEQARSGIAHELTFQRFDGRILVMDDFPKTLKDGSVEWNRNFTKESGIVLWTCLRHAQLTQDKAWLAAQWPQLVMAAEYIRHLRRVTRWNDSQLDDGLIPPGFADGGIWGTHAEYTNVYWNLVGLRALVTAAKWLGKAQDAAAWQTELDDFISTFRRAAERDAKVDARGNRYLPIRMDGKDVPQRGQWAFLHAVYPGQLFDRTDPLVEGNMAMLETTEKEGMVYGTGWVADGIWNYFASFYGHAWLWLGQGDKAVKALYGFGNHAAPTLVWREEQSLKGMPFEEFGDMPHNWASAEFIRLAVHLLAIDRGTELHLFEGLTRRWTQPGSSSALKGIATPFGPLNLSLAVAPDGATANLRVESLPDSSCTKVVVHLSGWAAEAGQRVIELDPRRAHELAIPIKR